MTCRNCTPLFKSPANRSENARISACPVWVPVIGLSRVPSSVKQETIPSTSPLSSAVV